MRSKDPYMLRKRNALVLFDPTCVVDNIRYLGCKQSQVIMMTDGIAEVDGEGSCLEDTYLTERKSMPMSTCT